MPLRIFPIFYSVFFHDFTPQISRCRGSSSSGHPLCFDDNTTTRSYWHLWNGPCLRSCRRTIAGLTARDKPVPTPIGLRGLRNQCPSAKLSDFLDPCRGLSTAPVSIHAPPWSSIPESASIISNFRIPQGQPTRTPPMRPQSPPTPAPHFTCRPRRRRPM